MNTTNTEHSFDQSCTKTDLKRALFKLPYPPSVLHLTDMRLTACSEFVLIAFFVVFVMATVNLRVWFYCGLARVFHSGLWSAQVRLVDSLGFWMRNA